jgi:hypothetical protein
MARYLVIHTPREQEEPEAAGQPSRLVDLASEHGIDGTSPRWLTTWTPDLHDDRLFTLWEADNADEIVKVLHDYRFLDNMDAQPLRVDEWGPEQVSAAHRDAEDA